MEEKGFLATLLIVLSTALWMAFYYAVVVLVGGLMVTGTLWCIDKCTGTSLSGPWASLMNRVESWFRRDEPSIVMVHEAPASTPEVAESTPPTKRETKKVAQA